VTLNVAGLHGFHAGDTIQIVDTSHSSAVVGSYVILDSDLYYGDDYFTISKFSDTARSTVDINLDTLADGAHTLPRASSTWPATSPPPAAPPPSPSTARSR
jgi:hypothetical protein